MLDRYTMTLENVDRIHETRMRRGSAMLHHAIEEMRAGHTPRTPSDLMWCRGGNPAGSNWGHVG